VKILALALKNIQASLIFLARLFVSLSKTTFAEAMDNKQQTIRAEYIQRIEIEAL
jgi:hypothetical protein